MARLDYSVFPMGPVVKKLHDDPKAGLFATEGLSSPTVIALEASLGLHPQSGFAQLAEGFALGGPQGLPNVVDLFTGTKMADDGAVYWEPASPGLEKLEPIEQLNAINGSAERLRKALERMAELGMQNEEINETIETICNALTDELRGPLRTMAGLSQLLLKENGWSMNATGRNYAERIAASAMRMDQLTQDLVKYGRMSRQDLACENISLETCVCEVVGAMAGTLAAKNAAIQMQRPFPQAWGNARTLRDVLAQLLDNMLLFAKAEAAPCVHVRAESGDSVVRLYIEENGSAQPGEVESNPDFVQVPGVPHSDIGIGMALVEKGMAKMGGRVNAEFEPGRTGRFWIELGHAH